MLRSSTCLFILVALVAARARGEEERDEQLTSVIRMPPYVVAATGKALFRAALDTKRWDRLELAPGMTPGGRLFRRPGDEEEIYYFRKPEMHVRDASGLFVSRDA